MGRIGEACIAALAAWALAGCSPQTAEAPAPTAAPEAASAHPVSGLEVIPVTITTSAGTRTIQAELAVSAEAQARGLMFRTEMGADEGMLFTYPAAKRLSFWMRNTVLPLDMVYIGPDQRVLNIIPNATPYSETPLLSDGLAIANLELNGGRAAELGIAPGDRVEW